MKNNLRCFMNRLLSIVTTFLIMASPVAAIVYASEPIETKSRYAVISHSANPEDALFTQIDLVGNKISEWKPDLLDDSIANTLILIRDKKTKL